jgi:hypothetical protein
VLTNPQRGNFAGDQGRDINSIRIQNQTRITFENSSLATGIWYNKKGLYHPIFQVIDYDSADTGLWARYDWEKGPFALTLGAALPGTLLAGQLRGVPRLVRRPDRAAARDDALVHGRDPLQALHRTPLDGRGTNPRRISGPVRLTPTDRTLYEVSESLIFSD